MTDGGGDGPPRVEEFEQFAADYFSAALLDAHSRDALPVNLPESRGDPAEAAAIKAARALPPVRPHVSMFNLGDDAAGWRALSSGLTFGTHTNREPWHRCLGVLRGHQAATAVLEHYYVCLDYRSEYAAFYAHLDAPRHSWASRVHFFGKPVNEDHLTRLTTEQRDSYLGYVVCRAGDLPLVGRAVLRTPTYIDECTAISEHVNFFGQSLEVVGIPFMQQDARYAVCAHVAAWAAHYTAHRRGMAERRLIAEFVSAGVPARPLRPHAPDALPATDVSRLLESVGFRATSYTTPAAGVNLLPPLTLEHVPQARRLRDELQAILPDDANVRREYTSHFAGDAYLYCLRPEATKSDSERAFPLAAELCELILDELLAPYIRSLCPIYVATFDHAMLLCGRSQTPDGVVHFFHDDDKGPYLGAASLLSMSRDELLAQTVVEEAFDDPNTPTNKLDVSSLPTDLTESVVARARQGDFDDTDRAIYTAIVPAPPRVLLPPSIALEQACRYMGRLLTPAGSRDTSTRVGDDARVTLLMGIDYKRDRRRQSLVEGDDQARIVFSSVQLAEWVLVVEGGRVEPRKGEATPQYEWEFVYDASSGPTQPRMQLVRIGAEVVVEYPGRERTPERAQLATRRFREVEVPVRTAKTEANKEQDEP